MTTETALTPEIEQFLTSLSLTTDGLIPAIAQQHDTGEVLMMAWMNRNSIRETLQSGRVCYWSRSRKAPWRKGDTSGHIQELVDLRVDCDGDTLLVKVEQTGVACHTGRHNCFFRAIRDGELQAVAPVEVDMTKIDSGKE
jgi:phosphoribosyl-AMP cyclohydrolase